VKPRAQHIFLALAALAIWGAPAVAATVAPAQAQAAHTAHLAFDAGDYHSLSVNHLGELWAWGWNTYGQLGDGTTTGTLAPKRIGAGRSWSAVSAGALHSVALGVDGALYTWGTNMFGQVGAGAFDQGNHLEPVAIMPGKTWKAIDAGDNHTLAISSEGELWAWGMNSDGQLGKGNHVNMYVPVRIGGQSNWATISAGAFHSLAVNEDGELWAWGGDYDSVPERVGSANNWSQVSAGFLHSLALTKDGELYAWGDNSFGQLGDGTYKDHDIPTRIDLSDDWHSIDTGFGHSLAIKSGGDLYAWGYNCYGQVGDGSSGMTATRPSPVSVDSDNKWASVTASGLYHSLGLNTDGELFAWGRNDYGQLGDKSTEDKSVPVFVLRLDDEGTALPKEDTGTRPSDDPKDQPKFEEKKTLEPPAPRQKRQVAKVGAATAITTQAQTQARQARTDQQAPSTLPPTGDSASVGLWLLLIAGGVISATLPLLLRSLRRVGVRLGICAARL